MNARQYRKPYGANKVTAKADQHVYVEALCGGSTKQPKVNVSHCETSHQAIAKHRIAMPVFTTINNTIQANTHASTADTRPTRTGHALSRARHATKGAEETARAHQHHQRPAP